MRSKRVWVEPSGTVGHDLALGYYYAHTVAGPRRMGDGGSRTGKEFEKNSGAGLTKEGFYHYTGPSSSARRRFPTSGKKAVENS
jgi:hypothetical protein